MAPMHPARGLHAADIKKAKEGGFHTCESLVMFPRKVRACVGNPGAQASRTKFGGNMQMPAACRILGAQRPEVVLCRGDLQPW